MIITRTPFRVSFIGGGSDIREFYFRNGYGAVIAAAIKKYMYIVIHPYFHDKIRIKYSKTEDVKSVEEIQHPIARECLKKVKVETGIEIASFADVAAGTGLGSSSAFTVGLLHALYAYKGKTISKERLAQEACEVEIDILGNPIGKQDQYSSVYGGINYFRFNSNEAVRVIPIILSQKVQKHLQDNILLYYIGGERKAGDILAEQKNNMLRDDKFMTLKKMVGLVDDLKKVLEEGDIDSFGSVLHQGWLYKKELASSISNEAIDSLYNKFMMNGASGGKVLGAGAGGFLLIYADNHGVFQKESRFKVLPFYLDNEGSKVIFRDKI